AGRGPGRRLWRASGGRSLPRPAPRYAGMRGGGFRRYGTKVYLVNTGWSGGGYGVGERINLKYTRAMVSAALNGDLDFIEFEKEEHFGLMIPTSCPGVPDEILNPKATWWDKAAYEAQAARLKELFEENYKRFG
ncbi:MAG: phosphoenolpyruvate carboxykinase (ATP), partial [Bacillota bacterium]